MGKTFTRKQILSRLQKTINEGRPIIGAGSSAGIIAKCAEIGGADLIIVYSTGKSRLMGLPTSPLGDSNDITLEMGKEMFNVVKDTPVIAGIEAADPTSMDLELLIESFVNEGYSGIINFPTIAMYHSPIYRKLRGSVGLGFSRELEMVKLARSMDIFTMAYVFSPEDTEEMVKAGADCVCPHVGGTSGGLVGFKGVKSFDITVKIIQEMVEAAKAINSDVICLSHGGPIATPEDTKYIYEHTDVVGYVGASSIERIPVERAVIETVRQFKGISIK